MFALHNSLHYMQNHLTLSQLNSLVKDAIEGSMDYAYWVQAEISSLSVRGHCYFDLVEKEDRSNTPVAKARANCWANQWQYISQNFLEVTGSPLASGMKVLLLVQPTFHISFGFAYRVMDIDPTFTVGDMQRKRDEIVRKLKEEGIFDLQKQLPFSAFAKNIAVISADTAAGYGDFCNQLFANSSDFAFKVELFQAAMQGEAVEQSVISALNSIFERIDEFDCVVIIRGGGAVSDMSGFDSLALAENVAQFPLPIITGIGHERDNCVLDLISHTRVKTPTAAAVFLIENLVSTLELITRAQDRIERAALLQMQNEKLRLQTLSNRIPALFSLVCSKQTAMLDQLYERIKNRICHNLESENHRLQLLSERVKLLDPELLLQRGYSMTMIGNKIVTSASQINPGDVLTTKLKDGSVTSVVK